ncbi:itaconate CoA-transferase [Pseudarthrobacter sp. W1I19]|uniref:CaiB/BaiF CoA transferase family protein n=1 Tax=Pseudarthrobacter sp. W1I19 TaxID=3042288 RepID=UPI002788C762|nr:CaiB/BaiF CoA-transferase family protein [Pseudarthrobacter sp. W1I19]MDQ0924601.1 itaconate CoA-transferase [Pseudarthrobacter sp. W1I19]
MTLPLTGITVVALEQAVAVPFATRQLADLGATVIKVERPGRGDFARDYDETVHGLSSHFIWLNRNKKSIVLDLKTESGKEALRRLISKADVFVQNLAPGAIERLGFVPEELCGEFPQLITCSLSGYGSGGPLGNKKAYDLLIQAEAGFLSVTGTEDEPAKAGISIADIAAGMYTYSGILSALYEREVTGKGRQLSVSLLDSLTEWMGFPYYYARYGGSRPVRAGAHHASIAPYGPVSCLDGSLLIAVQNEREWERFCTSVLNKPELSADPRFDTVSNRIANRADLDLLIDEQLGKRPVLDVAEALDEAGIAQGRMNDVADLDQHPQLLARNRISTVETEAGTVNAFLPVVESAGWVPRLEPVPAVGADTEAILSWLEEERVSA